MSLYLVTGRHAYREHQPGSTFEALLDEAAETRAVNRGNIRILERSTPTMRQGSWRLPVGWANTKHSTEGS